MPSALRADHKVRPRPRWTKETPKLEILVGGAESWKHLNTEPVGQGEGEASRNDKADTLDYWLVGQKTLDRSGKKARRRGVVIGFYVIGEATDDRVTRGYPPSALNMKSEIADGSTYAELALALVLAAKSRLKHACGNSGVPTWKPDKQGEFR